MIWPPSKPEVSNLSGDHFLQHICNDNGHAPPHGYILRICAVEEK